MLHELSAVWELPVAPCKLATCWRNSWLYGLLAVSDGFPLLAPGVCSVLLEHVANTRIRVGWGALLLPAKPTVEGSPTLEKLLWECGVTIKKPSWLEISEGQLGVLEQSSTSLTALHTLQYWEEWGSQLRVLRCVLAGATSSAGEHEPPLTRSILNWPTDGTISRLFSCGSATTPNANSCPDLSAAKSSNYFLISISFKVLVSYNSA